MMSSDYDLHSTNLNFWSTHWTLWFRESTKCGTCVVFISFRSLVFALSSCLGSSGNLNYMTVSYNASNSRECVENHNLYIYPIKSLRCVTWLSYSLSSRSSRLRVWSSCAIYSSCRRCSPVNSLLRVVMIAMNK
jgi:hypothetical protein